MADFMGKFKEVFGTVADKTKEYAGVASEKAKEYAGVASDKAKDFTRIAKLTVEINGEKDTVKKAYTEIGKLYYDAHKDEPDELFAQLCDEVTVAMGNISAKEAEIAEIRAKSSQPDDSVEVEFENIVAETEDAAEEAVEAAEEAVEAVEAAETVTEAVEEAADAVEEAVEEAAEKTEE